LDVGRVGFIGVAGINRLKIHPYLSPQDFRPERFGENREAGNREEGQQAKGNPKIPEHRLIIGILPCELYGIFEGQAPAEVRSGTIDRPETFTGG
jgi:hypothetical protein